MSVADPPACVSYKPPCWKQVFSSFVSPWLRGTALSLGDPAPSWLSVAPAPPACTEPAPESATSSHSRHAASAPQPPGEVLREVKGSPGAAGVFWAQDLFSSISITSVLSVP